MVFPGLASALSRAGFERKLQAGPHPFHVSESQRFDRGGKQTGDFATLASPQRFWTALNAYHRDPVAQEARWLVVDKTVPGSELLQTFVAGTVPSTLANGPTSAYFYDGTELVRFDVGLSSEFDPTRTLSFNAASGVATLVDTTANRVETYDAAGRLTQQSQRTGEPLRGVTYVDSNSDLVASLTDPVGGATTFTYDGTGHLAAIMDGAGRVTGMTVNSAGDLVSVTEPDGEVETFQYQDHRVSQKRGPNGDVTTYTYASDGSLQTATKPAGEVTSLAVAFSQPPQRDPSGNTLNAGSYTDTHGVAHSYTLDFQGHIALDTYVASGVSYANSSIVSVRPTAFLTFARDSRRSPPRRRTWIGRRGRSGRNAWSGGGTAG